MGTYLYQVAGFSQLCDDLFEVILAPDRVQDVMPFQSGQYIELLYPDGNYYPFSIANAPNADGELILHMRLHPDDHAMELLILQLQQTGEVELRGPLGQSIYCPESQKPIVMVAGGTGIAPMKAIIEAARDEQELHLFWGAKSPEELYLDDFFQELLSIEKLNTYVPVISGEQEWRGENGWVHQVVVDYIPDLQGKLVYVSGPYEMVASAQELYLHYGLDPDDFLTDVL